MKLTKAMPAIVVLFLLISSAGAYAQNNATLSGNVQDTTGAIIPGATIKLTSQAQGIVRTAQTNEAGLYQFSFLPAGIYDIEVSIEGFKTVTQKDITIAVAQNLRRDISMEVGSVTENVTVSANVETINTESAEIGAIIDNTKVVEMPLNGRTFYSLATLTPGVAAPLNNQGFRGAFSVAGACQTCNNFTLNGMDNNDPTVAIPNFRPSIDAIQEFNILTGIYGAQYGLGSGGQIIVSTKSGSNEFHGSVYEFLRNSAMDARNFFSRGPIPSFKRNQFGATFGGPIIRNKTFFFYSYEGLRLSQAVTQLTTVPMTAMKNGDFSGLLPARVIRDPLTNQPFPGNIIPPSRFNAVAVDLLKFYPEPAFPTPQGQQPSQNYLFNVPRPERYNQHSVKLDHQFSSKDSMYFTANYYKNSSIETGTSSTCNNTTLPAFPCDLSIKNEVFGVSETHIFSPSLINEARFAYTYTYTPSSARSGRIDFWGKYGVKPLLVSFAPKIPDKGVPQVTVTGFNGFPSARTFERDDPHWQISDTLSWTRNKHTAKFGVNILHYHTGNTDLSSQGGTLTFTNTSQGPTTGYAMADWLLGLPASTANTPYRYRNDINLMNIASFVQDDWKVTTRLTLNLGLRWEINTPITDDNHRLTNFDPVRGIPVTQANPAMNAPFGTPVVGFGERPYNFDWNGFAPRLGFSWQPFSDGKTVLRGGAGTFLNSYSLNNSLGGLFAGYPYQTTFTYTSSLTNPISLSNPFSGNATTSNSLNGAEMNFKNARTYQWSFGIQRQIASDMVGDVTYFASRSNHLQATRNINQPPPGPGTPAQVNARRPYPAYGTINLYQWDRNASFHSLQTKLQKRYAYGLSFLATYMYSHNIDDLGTPPNQNDRSSIRGSSTTDVRHRFVASPVYELPFGKGRKFLANGVASAILGGWQISALIQSQTGNPQTPTLSGNFSNTAASNDRPDVYGDPNKNAPRTPQKWFDTSVFLPLRPASGQAGAAYSFGNAGKGIIKSPGLNTTDVSIVRSFSIRERATVQFRGEFFNVFNHTNFNFPNVQVDSPNFGAISSAQDPRQIQLALKILF
ncbi:MAG: TonB-dependent receptor [Acidobacteria bacterium]|nr:TonB-dependent receptor [Acidobacteriota bacterium]